MKLTKVIVLILVLVLLLPSCEKEDATNSTPQIKYEKLTEIILSDSEITVNGSPASTLSDSPVYTANDIIYYESGTDFTYGEGTQNDMHDAADADAHTVVHITKAGNYKISGTLSRGQIAIDLGDGAKNDENAVVTLILSGVDIICEVAPAIIFYNVYECGSTDTSTATKDVDTSRAGANVIIADGTENSVRGAYVARIYKPDSVVLSEDGTSVADAKKLHKYDGALYSKMSMNVDGEKDGSGVLTINAANEGLDSELHLTINGGNIKIYSGNDGINTNEDGVSVTTVNGGTLNINVLGTTGEGDGIDSNGWLVINGGSITAYACMYSMDAGIDSDMGIYINGGKVLAVGNMFGRIENSGQNYAVFNFQHPLGTINPIVLENDAGESVMSVEQRYYRNIFFSSPELKTGVYTIKNSQDTLWVKANDGNMQHPGMPGEIPGETPPQMSESFDQSLDKPQKPNGEGSGIYPMNTDDYKTEFEVVDGANFYSVIEPNKIIWSD